MTDANAGIDCNLLYAVTRNVITQSLALCRLQRPVASRFPRRGRRSARVHQSRRYRLASSPAPLVQPVPVRGLFAALARMPSASRRLCRERSQRCPSDSSFVEVGMSSTSKSSCANHQVVHGLEATDRRLAVQTGMGPVPVVVVQPSRQVVRTLLGAAVGPLAQGGLDEALGLAVGTRAVGTGTAVLQGEPSAQTPEAARARRAVMQARRARLAIALEPCVGSTDTDAGGLGGLCDAQTVLEHAPHK